jgi:hypothetical protein
MTLIKLLFIDLIILFLSAEWSAGQCLSMTVIGPTGVTEPGYPMKFQVEVGAVSPRLEYSWMVDAGSIVSGQGTPAITVATDKKMQGSNVTATVKIEGLPAGCEKVASGIAPVASKLEWESLDEWGDLNDNDVRDRVDALFAYLTRDSPRNTALFILHLTKNERHDARNRRIQLVVRHAKFRKFDTGRIWFCLLESRPEAERTTIYTLPPGLEADIPYENCLIIKGGDIK